MTLAVIGFIVFVHFYKAVTYNQIILIGDSNTTY